jgi:hypothetical protein
MNILALDISGNFHEGKGTTGICRLYGSSKDNIYLSELKAEDFDSQVEYWATHQELIERILPDYLVVEGYKLYNHKGKSASMQANSNLETPQLLGAIKLVAYRMDIPITIQYASDVKTRWSEDVLTRLGYLEQKGNRYYFDGKLTSTHKRDALKHALHFERYGKR